MDFYSTYYKKLANYKQIKEVGEKFNVLDTNGDKALNKDEIVNIFSMQTFTEDEKNMFMSAIDSDDNGFITYTEFMPTFIEFDVDQDGMISQGEYDLTKKRLEALEKQSDIFEKYSILNDITRTEQEKDSARKDIEKFNIERKIIIIEQEKKEKDILIANISVKTQEIQQFINDNTLLEFEEEQKLKEIEDLEAKGIIYGYERDIADKKREVELVNLDLWTAQQTGISYEIASLEQRKISKENDLEIKEKILENHYNSLKIEKNEKLLQKFFIPEIIKEKARTELDKLYDETQLTNQRMELYEQVSQLSLIRADINQGFYDFIIQQDASTQQQLLELSLPDLYQYIVDNDSQTQQLLDDLDAQQAQEQLEAQISSLKVELINTNIRLKEVLPRSDIKPFDQLKETLVTEISNLETEIANLEAQLP